MTNELTCLCSNNVKECVVSHTFNEWLWFSGILYAFLDKTLQCDYPCLHKKTMRLATMNKSTAISTFIVAYDRLRVLVHLQWDVMAGMPVVWSTHGVRLDLRRDIFQGWGGGGIFDTSTYFKLNVKYDRRKWQGLAKMFFLGSRPLFLYIARVPLTAIVMDN